MSIGDHGMDGEGRDKLTFSLDPETLDEGSAEEKAGFGTIKVVADGHCLTEGFDGHVQIYRDGPLASGYHLAEWLIWNWWRLRWEPPRPQVHRTLEWAFAHRMSTIGEGYVWPNVTIYSDGFQSVLTSERSSQHNTGSFRYFGGPTASIPAKCLESAIDRFASDVLKRLREAELGDTNLHRLWGDLRIEREDPTVSCFRRLEALLGRDPGEADAKEIERHLADAADLGEDALEEVAAGTEPRAQGPIDMLSAVRIKEIAKQQGFDAKPADAVRLDSGTSLPVWEEIEAWRVGEAAADAIRRQEQLGMEPIGNARLVEIAGTTAPAISDLTRRSDELAFALDNDGEGTRMAFRSKGGETGRRFELARLIGDRLFGGTGPLFPVTQAYGYRQRAQRAFAAELLSPFDAVNEMLGNDDSDEKQADIAQHYQVSPRVIQTLLVNKGRISLQDAPDLLDRTHY